MKRKEFYLISQILAVVLILIGIVLVNEMPKQIRVQMTDLDINSIKIWVGIIYLTAATYFLSVYELLRIILRTKATEITNIENAKHFKRIAYYALINAVIYIVMLLIFTLSSNLSSFVFLIGFSIVVVGLGASAICTVCSYLIQKNYKLEEESRLVI